MTAVPVPPIPPPVLERRANGVITNSARIGSPVIGRGQWREIAEAQNWLLGGGSRQLGWWDARVVTSGSTTTFRTYCWPSSQSYSRMWTFCVIGDGGFGAFATIDTPGGKSWQIPNTGGGIHVISFYELVASTDNGGEEIANDFVVSSDSPDVLVLSASCFELPCSHVGALVADAPGIYPTSLDKWHPIQDRTDGGVHPDERHSIAGVAYTAAWLPETGHAYRRAKIFDWSLEGGVTLSSSSYTNIFRLNPSCQTRQVLGETQREVQWAAYASASTSSGQIRCTSSVGGGSSSTLSIVSASPAWYTGTIEIACDDISEDGWIAGGVRETLTFEHRSTTGNIITYGVCVGE